MILNCKQLNYSTSYQNRNILELFTCAIAFEVCKSPISVGFNPYSLLRYGNNGRTILNPNISTSTNKNRETNGLILQDAVRS